MVGRGVRLVRVVRLLRFYASRLHFIDSLQFRLLLDRLEQRPSSMKYNRCNYKSNASRDDRFISGIMAASTVQWEELSCLNIQKNTPCEYLG